MEKTRKLECLDRVLTESYSYPVHLNGIKEWMESFIDKIEKHFEGEDEGDDREYCMDEWFREHGSFVTILFLFDKGYLKDAQVKELLQGMEFGNSCGGQWQEDISREFGVVFE